MEIFTILPELNYTFDDFLQMVIRILIAAALGALVGFERSIKKKDVGVRTHCLVAAAAATFMIIGKYGFADISEEITGGRGADNARIAAQVISGVSFLCAAVIFKSKNGIKGLSTAGGMWATAALGIATGAGMYIVAIALTVVLIFIQFLMPLIHFSKGYRHTYEWSVGLIDDGETYKKFIEFLNGYGCKIEEPNKIKRDNGIIYFDVNSHSAKPIPDKDVNDFIFGNKNVIELLKK